MYFRNLFLFLVAGLFLEGYAQVIPADNSALNFTSVYFEESIVAGAAEYELICFDSLPGKPAGSSTVSKNTVPGFWLHGLTWGGNYYWRIKAYDKNKTLLEFGTLHNFRLLQIAGPNGEETRLTIKTNKHTKHAGGYICVDYARAIFDRDGHFVWLLPKVEGVINNNTSVRDIRITKENTLTFLSPTVPCEIDLEGNLLWKAPYPYLIGTDTVIYHHDFRKTNRGTYLVLGTKNEYRKLTGMYDREVLRKNPLVKFIDSVPFIKTQIPLVLEFNKVGEVIWLWNSNSYFKDEDLNYKKNPDGTPNFMIHSNALSENDAGTEIYVGLRDFSRILKVNKQSEKVELSFGEKYPSGEATFGDELFFKQHDASVTKHNSLLVFNNNRNKTGGGDVASVLELNTRPTSKENLLLWSFRLDFDTLTNGKSISGGNVVELPNSNLLVCAGLLNRVFEVSRKKEVVWDAFVEFKRNNEWQAAQLYRCNWVRLLKRYCFIPVIVAEAGKTKKITIQINNTGNTADQYQIDVLDTEGKVLSSSKTTLIKENQKSSMPLDKKIASSDKKKIVVIRSLLSPTSKERQLQLN